MLMLKKQ